MIFNSLDFLVFFFIVLCAISFWKFRRFQHLFLIASSIFFLYYSDNLSLAILVFTIFFHFYIGNKIYQSGTRIKKKILLIIGLSVSLGTLGFFKYSNFIIEQINPIQSHFAMSEIPLLDIALPIGISFYTFHSLTYTIDIYRGILKPVTLKEYALFVSFFPQLVAGPILRAKEFLPQIREKIEGSSNLSKLKLIVIHNTNLKFGITLMTIGFIKKMFFADNIAPFVNETFSNPIGLESFSIIIGAIAFAIQIYCDFSGYSDIAIGAASILGFKIPLNFNKPFFATSPSDYWTRWHISLSTWVRDYLYLPMIFKNRNSSLLIVSSLMISMILIGFWHGASWNFVIWGFVHGLYLAGHTILRKKLYKTTIHNLFKTKIGKVLGILITQYLIVFAFIIFRVNDLEMMVYAIKKYVMIDFVSSGTLELIKNNEFAVLLLSAFVILEIISYKMNNLPERLSNFRLRYWVIFLFMSFLLVSLFYVGSAQEFIYFQF